MSTGTLNSVNPPSTDPNTIDTLWRNVRTMTPSPANDTPESSGSWNNTRRMILRQDWGIEVCWTAGDNEDEITLSTFAPSSEDIKDHPLFIHKTDAELTELAECGADLINTAASEAACAAWIATLLPPAPMKGIMFCRHSEFIIPRALPEGIIDQPRYVPWLKIKPDGVWFYAVHALEQSSRLTLDTVLGSSIFHHATLALNFENKSLSGSIGMAQLQGIMVASIGLSERIKIREEACQNKNVSDLSQYFLIFWPMDIQLWRLKKTASGNFHAWKMNLPHMRYSDVDGIRSFISVWNRLIGILIGPARESLEHDLSRIAAKSNKRKPTVTQSKRAAKTNEQASTVCSTIETRPKRAKTNKQASTVRSTIETRSKRAAKTNKQASTMRARKE